jgi:hypothetical protein
LFVLTLYEVCGPVTLVLLLPLSGPASSVDMPLSLVLCVDTLELLAGLGAILAVPYSSHKRVVSFSI